MPRGQMWYVIPYIHLIGVGKISKKKPQPGKWSYRESNTDPWVRCNTLPPGHNDGQNGNWNVPQFIKFFADTGGSGILPPFLCHPVILSPKYNLSPTYFDTGPS